tara:strand:+ start:1652 stop:2197 length:546 start_codon:yes stop_codon:yes gene_type:complete
MQLLKFFFTIFIMGSINSCSYFDEKQCSINTIGEPLAEDTVYLQVNITIQKNDIFRVYYIPEGKDSFNDQGYIEQKIIGSNEPQYFVFKFPKGTYLKKIRLDISESRQNQYFSIHLVKFLFENKCFEITENFSYFFKGNKFIFGESNELYNYRTKDLDNKYDPHFLSKNLINVMDYLLYKD